MSSNCSGYRSISDIIESVKTSFLESDSRAAVRELMGREEVLRREKEEKVVSLMEKCDVLEAEVGELKVQKCAWEEERRRLRRHYDVSEDKLKDLARELSLMKEKELEGIKRYDRLLVEVKEMDGEKDVFIGNLAYLTDMVEKLKKSLREKEGVIDEIVRKRDTLEEELEEVRKKNAFLEEEKVKYDAGLEELKREKDERIKEVLEKNEVEKRQVEAKVRACQKELEGMRRENASLEEQRAATDARVEELRKSNGDKDERIKKLLEDVEFLERDKKEIVKENDKQIEKVEKEKEGLVLVKKEFAAKLRQVEEKFLKLEEDVITCMCLDLGRDKRFASSHIGKIISGIMKALDSEGNGITCNAEVVKDGNPQEADSAFASHVYKSKCSLKSDKKSVEDVQRALDFEAENSRENGSTGNKRTVIDLINLDSDDDDENPQHVNGLKNKRQCHGSASEIHKHGGSGDDSLKPKLETKKLEYVQQVKQKLEYMQQVKQEPSLAALSDTRSAYKCNTLQRQPLAAIKRCEEKFKSGEQTGSFSKDDDKPYKYGTPKDDKIRTPQVEEYMTIHRQKQQNKKLECVADMVCAFDKDFDFCAKAVCALYRQQKSGFAGMNGFSGSKGLEECDSQRIGTLAKFLIDGDSSGKMKKSVDELQQADRDDCRRLAKKYSRQLIDVYRKRSDPLFSPLSTDLQYK